MKAKLTIETEYGQTFTMELEKLHINEDIDTQTHYDGPCGPPITTTSGAVHVTITGIYRRGK